MTLSEKLTRIFNNLDLSIGYLSHSKAGNKWSYNQRGKSVILGDVYYDMKSGFITPSTIKNNRDVLFKLKEYEEFCNINYIPDENGFKVEVWNKLGILIYRNYILFYDKWIQPINYIVNKILRNRYPDLVI